VSPEKVAKEYDRATVFGQLVALAPFSDDEELEGTGVATFADDEASASELPVDGSGLELTVVDALRSACLAEAIDMLNVCNSYASPSSHTVSEAEALALGATEVLLVGAVVSLLVPAEVSSLVPAALSLLALLESPVEPTLNEPPMVKDVSDLRLPTFTT